MPLAEPDYRSYSLKGLLDEYAQKWEVYHEARGDDPVSATKFKRRMDLILAEVTRRVEYDDPPK